MSILERLHQSLFGSLEEKEKELRKQESALQAELQAIDARRVELQEESARVDLETIEQARALNNEALQAAKRERQRLEKLAAQRREEAIEEGKARLDALVAEQRDRLAHLEMRGQEMAQLELKGRELWADIVRVENQSQEAALAIQRSVDDLRALGVKVQDPPERDAPPDHRQAVLAAIPDVLDVLRGTPRLGSHATRNRDRIDSIVGHFCEMVVRFGSR